MTNQTLHPNSLWQIMLKYIGTTNKECLLAMVYWNSISLMGEQYQMLPELLDMMLL